MNKEIFPVTELPPTEGSELHANALWNWTLTFQTTSTRVYTLTTNTQSSGNFTLTFQIHRAVPDTLSQNIEQTNAKT